MLVALKQENPLLKGNKLLGKLLGDTIREIAGEASLQIVEELRRLPWDGRRRSE
jgi:phosphoenolpyruvate carboxylase